MPILIDKEEPSCATCGHREDEYCDIHNSNLVYPDGNHGCGYWQSTKDINDKRCETCLFFEFTTPANTWGRCNGNFVIRKEIHENWFVCSEFKSKEVNHET